MSCVAFSAKAKLSGRAFQFLLDRARNRKLTQHNSLHVCNVCTESAPYYTVDSTHYTTHNTGIISTFPQGANLIFFGFE